MCPAHEENFTMKKSNIFQLVVFSTILIWYSHKPAMRFLKMQNYLQNPSTIQRIEELKKAGITYQLFFDFKEGYPKTKVTGCDVYQFSPIPYEKKWQISEACDTTKLLLDNNRFHLYKPLPEASFYKINGNDTKAFHQEVTEASYADLLKTFQSEQKSRLYTTGDWQSILFITNPGEENKIYPFGAWGYINITPVIKMEVSD
jgi:hypothetical protein